jgi:hypothetical protein
MSASVDLLSVRNALRPEMVGGGSPQPSPRPPENNRDDPFLDWVLSHPRPEEVGWIQVAARAVSSLPKEVTRFRFLEVLDLGESPVAVGSLREVVMEFIAQSHSQLIVLLPRDYVDVYENDQELGILQTEAAEKNRKVKTIVNPHDRETVALLLLPRYPESEQCVLNLLAQNERIGSDLL